MGNYTEEMEKELVDRGAWTWAEATEYAGEHGLKPRSVIAKIISLKLPYEPKPVKVTKTGEPVVRKSQFVSAIQTALGGIELRSLDKVTKADLESLAAGLTEFTDLEMPEAS